MENICSANNRTSHVGGKQKEALVGEPVDRLDRNDTDPGGEDIVAEGGRMVVEESESE